MSEVMEKIVSRRSIRSFKSDMVPKELIEQYLAQLKDNSADPEQKKTA